MLSSVEAEEQSKGNRSTGVAKKPNGPAASSGSGGRTCAPALHTPPPSPHFGTNSHMPFLVRTYFHSAHSDISYHSMFEILELED